MGITELQSFRTLEGGFDRIGDIAVSIRIPCGPPLLIIIAQLFQFIDTITINQQLEG